MSKVRSDNISNRADDGAPALVYGAEVPVGYGITGAGGINITGIVTAASGSFTGNVSVGGVLTYEDVASIDSVGIITARSDVSIADKIIHTGDTNTAIRFPAADTFTVETGGTEALRIGSDQKVYFGDFASAGSKAYIEKEVSGDFKLNIHASSSTSQNRIITFNNRDDVEALRIDASSNVGIGTTNPAYNLEVFGNNALISGSSAANLILEDRGVADASNPFFLLSSDGAEFKITTADRNASGTTTNSSERLRVDSSGRLLIGATSSAGNAILTVQGLAGNTAEQGIFALRRSSGNGTNNKIGVIEFSGGDNNQAAIIQAVGDNTWGTDDYPGRLEFYTTADGASSPTERLRIASDGKVLVGTEAGRSAGDVNGQFQIEGTNFQAASMNLISNTGASGSNNVHISLCKSRGSSDGSNTIVASEDNLGTIQWCGADGSDLNSVAAMVQAFVDGTPGSNDMPGRLSFWTTPDGAAAPTERMRITSGGNIGIGGVTDPEDYHASANSLVSGGGITLANTTQGSIFFADSASGTGEYVGQINYVHSGNEMTFVNNNSERMRFLSGGELAFNCVSRPQSGVNGVFFDSNIITIGSDTTAGQDRMRFENPNNRVGSISATATGVNYNTSSDYRLKENVVDITDGITRVKQLSPRRFNFIADDTTTLDGFLAHEAQTVVPEAVTGTHNEVDDDGKAVMQNIDQSKLVPLLTAALQEAIAEIESLKTRVAALEG